MKILITGTSQGIGKAIAELFLKKGHTVIGIDRQSSAIEHSDYIHYQCDVRDTAQLPAVEGVDVLINNAGTQNEDDIDINLKALIYITEKYGVQPNIKSILNIGSASAHTGAEFPDRCWTGSTLLWKFPQCILMIFGPGLSRNPLLRSSSVWMLPETGSTNGLEEVKCAMHGWVRMKCGNSASWMILRLN